MFKNVRKPFHLPVDLQQGYWWVTKNPLDKTSRGFWHLDHKPQCLFVSVVFCCSHLSLFKWAGHFIIFLGIPVLTNWPIHRWKQQWLCNVEFCSLLYPCQVLSSLLNNNFYASCLCIRFLCLTSNIFCQLIQICEWLRANLACFTFMSWGLWTSVNVNVNFY